MSADEPKVEEEQTQELKDPTKTLGDSPLPKSLPKRILDICKKCGTKLSLPFPQLLTFEGVVASTIVIPHIKGIECPNCGIYHNIIIAPSEIRLALWPMKKPTLNEDEEESKIIQFNPNLHKLPT